MRAGEADLVLWVTDVSAEGRAPAELPRLKSDAPQWLVENKIDLLADGLRRRSRSESCCHPQKDEFQFAFSVSAQCGEGLDTLFKALAGFARDYFAAGETALVTRARHRRALEETLTALDRALTETASRRAREELIAEELRAATSALGRLTGRIDVEDVLDKIFREFCIGK
jgi:tRNA modification GTPase